MHTFFATAAVAALLATTTYAQDHGCHGTVCTHPLPVESTDSTDYGTYGYRHPELHAYGSIQELMAATGESCCDGGMGGECRATTIRRTGVQWEFLRGDVWCPISAGGLPIATISLPTDVSAVVCTNDEYLFPGQCPSATYCVGTSPGA